MEIDKSIIEGLRKQGLLDEEMADGEVTQEVVDEVTQGREPASELSPLETVKKNFGQSRLGKAVETLSEGLETSDPDHPLANPGLTDKQIQTIDQNVLDSPIGQAISGDPNLTAQKAVAEQANVAAEAIIDEVQVNQAADLVSLKAMDDANIVKAPPVAEQKLQKELAITRQEKELAGNEAQKNRYNLMSQEYLKRQEALAKDYEAKVSIEVANLQNEGDALRKELTQAKIDPSRWWGSRTTGQKIGLAISAFLGGGDVIERMIDKDIEAQRANIQNKQGLYSKVLERVKNSEDALRSTKAMYMQQVAQQFEMQSRQTADQFRAQEYKMKAQEFNMKAYQLTQEIAQKRILNQAYGGTITPQMAAMLPKEDRARYIPELGQLAPDVDSAKKAREIKGNFESTMKTLEAAIAHRKEYGAETLNRKAMATGRSLSNQLTLAVKNAFNLGVLSAQDVELVEGVTGGDLSSLGYIMPRLEAFKSQMEQQYKTKMKALGIDPNIKHTRNNFRPGI